jgi:hypothetical protein
MCVELPFMGVIAWWLFTSRLQYLQYPLTDFPELRHIDAILAI